MKRPLLIVVSLLLALSACDKQEVTYRDIEVKLGSTLATTNSDGDVAYNYLDALSTDVDFRGRKMFRARLRFTSDLTPTQQVTPTRPRRFTKRL